MKFREFKRYLGIFIVAVLIIAVYKTFDNIGNIFEAIGSFFGLLSPIIIAFAIAFLLYPVCSKMQRMIEKSHLPIFFVKRARGFSVLAVYIAMLCVVTGIFYLLLPTLIQSLTDFVNMIPSIAESIVVKLNESKFIHVDLNQIEKYINFKTFLQDNGWLDVDVYTSKIISLSTNVINFLFSLIASIYILLDRSSLSAFCKKAVNLFVSKEKRDFVMIYVRRAVDFAYKYFFCVIIDALIIFVISFVILSIMGIKYAPVLALMLGLFNLVPYFGAISACAISVIITIITSKLSTGLILAVILLALQQIDANVIQPHLIKGRLSVKPFWVLVGILVGGGMFGIWGILLAIPTIALLRTIIDDYFDYRLKKLQYKSK